MSAIRGIWCLFVSHDENQQREVLFSRRFTTVERKEQRAAVQAEANFEKKLKENNIVHTEEYKYTPLPPTDQFLLDNQLFPIPSVSVSPVTQIPPARLFPVIENICSEEISHFEDISQENEKLKLEGIQSPIWPVVYMSKRGLHWIAIPALLKEIPKTNERPKLIDLNCVTTTILLLNQMHDLVQLIHAQKNISIRSASIWEEVASMVSWIMPFGSPIESHSERARNLYINGFPPKQPSQLPKRPAWKPYSAKGKPSMEFIIEEKIQFVQYDNPQSPDVMTIIGSVSCLASLPGTPEVTLSLTTNPSNKMKITDVAFAPFVQFAEIETHQKKLAFTPPLERFTLCDYHVIGLEKAPIRGFYQMKQINMVQSKILVQLKLTEGVNNQFEKFIVNIPFFNRGKIINADMSQNFGNISASKNTLIWSLGPKINTRNNEMILRATVNFDPNCEEDTGNVDPFCIDQNAYIDIQFEIEDYTISALQLEHKIPSAQNIKLPASVKRSVKSFNYKVWNSLGCSPKVLNIFSQTPISE